MKRKSTVPFLCVCFCFTLFPARLIWAQNSSIVEGVTDAQWLQFMDDHAFKMTGFKAKLPLLALELNLSAADQQEVKNLFSDHGDEELLSRMATSPGIKGSSQDEKLDADQTKSKNSNYIEMEDKADDAPAETLDQVKVVRRLLGSKDSDFRFWFYEEAMIDQAEDDAYRHHHDYSTDALTASLLQKMELTQEFKDFKARKLEFIHSDQKAEAYFSNWNRLVERRVLLQRQLARHQSLVSAS